MLFTKSCQDLYFLLGKKQICFTHEKSVCFLLFLHFFVSLLRERFFPRIIFSSGIINKNLETVTKILGRKKWKKEFRLWNSFPNMTSGEAASPGLGGLGGLGGAAAGVGPTSSSRAVSGVLAGSLSGRKLLVEGPSVSMVIISGPVKVSD